ncbi:MAG TPA: glycoside hydrolase family 32 protein [Symbiobacteriaceae bacterium]
MNHHERLVAEASRFLAEQQHQFQQDPYRLAYHVTPPVSWMNDPNGMIYYRGEYHLFYQLYPFAPKNGPKYWGHVKSKDLVHWEHLPVALAPSEPYDAGGCWSGTAVEHEGKLFLFYTGADDDTKAVPVQTVNIAVSSDGVRFQKHPANPVVTSPPPEGSGHFRDPKVWKHGDAWYMVLGTTKEGRGKLALYRSTDLIRWTYVGVAVESDGTQGYMWECPDLFRLGDKHVLIVSPMGARGQEHAQPIALVGRFDYAAGKFIPERTQVLDAGPSFYAPQTLLDGQGRRILIGWMEKWGASMPTQQHGWAGAMSIPRVMDLLPDGSIGLRPVPELAKLRRDHRRWESVTVAPDGQDYLQGFEGDTLELIACFDLAGCTARRFGIKVRCCRDRHQETVVAYDPVSGRLEVNRDRSGIGDGGSFGGDLKLAPSEQLRLHLFLDRSSLEVFGNEGRLSITQRIYPRPAGRGVDLFAEGGSVRLVRLDVWQLE